MSGSESAAQQAPPGDSYRAVRFEYSAEYPRVLAELGASLLVSTYQAGKLATVGVRDGALTFSFHNFRQIMGLAVADGRLAVGCRQEIYFLNRLSDVPGAPGPADHDACWLTRRAQFTGNILSHELAWGSEGLWIVNTRFSTLCTLHDDYSFVPRWRPRFVSALTADDRCHLNGLAMEAGQPKYVTAHGECNEPAGWRPGKASGGCLIDVPSGETVARGLSMPHSPRLYAGRLWALDSGRGRLLTIDPQNGQATCVCQLPGFTRGLAFHGPYSFVGLSKIRETAVFGGLPIAERREDLRCGVAVVDLRSGRAVAQLQFHSGVEEIFAVEVLPGCQRPLVCGPAGDEDGEQSVWIVPGGGAAAATSLIVPPSAAAPAPAPEPAVVAASDAKACGFLIQRARPRDLPQLETWLPQAFVGQPRPEFLIALEQASGTLAGAASLRIITEANAGRAGRFLVFVDPLHRRRGCGAALLKAVIEGARTAGVARLESGWLLAEGDAEAEFFAVCGLSRTRESGRYQFELAAGDAVFAPLQQRLLAAGRIPAGVQIGDLDSARPEAIAEFAAGQVGKFAESVLARIGGGSEPYHRQLSTVIQREGQILGVLLTSAVGKSLVVDIRAVSPDFRGGWVNVALMYRTTQESIRHGLRYAVLEADSRLHRETLKLVRRCHGVAVGRRFGYGLELVTRPLPSWPTNVEAEPAWLAGAAVEGGA